MLTPQLTWSEVLDVLRGGKSVERRITIPEGWSLEQIVPQLARVLNVAASIPCRPPCATRRCFTRSTSRRRRSRDISFPDTYVFPDGHDTARRGAR